MSNHMELETRSANGQPTVSVGPSCNRESGQGEDKEDDLLSSTKVSDAVDELLRSPIPDCNTPRNKELMNHVLKYLDQHRWSWKQEADAAILASMTEYALTRHNLELWNQIVSLSVTNYGNYIFDEHEADVKRACRVFGFGNVRSSLEQMLHKSHLKKAIPFLRDMPSCMSGLSDVVGITKWCKEQSAASVKAVKYWMLGGELEIMISLVNAYGVECLLDMDHVIKGHDMMKFALVFVNYLLGCRGALSKPPNQQASNYSESREIQPSRTVIDHVIHQWVTAVSDFAASWFQRQQNDLLKSFLVRKAVELCLRAGQPEICHTVLVSASLNSETSAGIQKLCYLATSTVSPLLRQFQSPVYSPPFANFFRQLIEQYSRLLLGSRTHNPQVDLLFREIDKKFDCKCRHCIELNAFMKQLYVPQKTFLVSRKGYHHFDKQMGSTGPPSQKVEWAKLEKYRSPHGLCVKVTKSQRISAGQRWDGRVQAFGDFLTMIGEREDIERLMEERFDNLKEIMKG